MPAKKDFVEWFTKMFPHSCIDGDHARSCLAGWNAAEEKFTGAQHTQLAICVLAKSFPVSCEHLVNKKWCGFHMECPHKQQTGA